MVTRTSVVLQMWLRQLLLTSSARAPSSALALAQPAGTRQLQSSPEVPEDVHLPSLLLAEAWGRGGNFPWRSHGIQLEAAWFSISSSVCETNAWLRASYAERPKWEGRARSRAGWGESRPSRCPPGTCFPAAVLSLQPPPVPWLRKPAEVQPTFTACCAKMSQSLRLLKMTQAQLTHVYLVRGMGERQKNIVWVSDVPNLFLLAAMGNFVRYRWAIGNF